MLKARPGADVRVLVVWEPVLPTDWGTPSSSLTSFIPDSRSIQFWDHDRRLSTLLGGSDNIERLAHESKVGFVMKNVIWDAAFVYPPGAAWGTPANLLVAPVVEFRDDVAATLVP